MAVHSDNANAVMVTHKIINCKESKEQHVATAIWATCYLKATPNKFPVSRLPPASHSIARISALFVLQATIAAVEDLLSATDHDLCCSKAVLPWTIFELGDDRTSLGEFYRHISTYRNEYYKLCGCSTSLKYLLKCKFPATNNKNNRPPACMSKPFPGRVTGFGVA